MCGCIAFAGFTAIEENADIFQIKADYHKFTVWGYIEITLTTASEGMIRVSLHTTANVDNIYALFSSPVDKIANAFKQAL